MTQFTASDAKKELARRELARRHFKHFNSYVDEGYMSSWHTELMCDALQRFENKEIRWLIMELPPRHGKSLHLSQRFPAWVVGRKPDTDVIIGSYSGDLSSDHGRETRNLIKTQEYQNVFDTRLAPDSSAKGKWNTQKKDERGQWVNAKGAYNAAGVGGSITGKGADFFIIDDAFKDRKEADSQVIRESVWSWFRSVARTRLTPTGGMCVTMTRWHEDDLIGRIVDGADTKEPWVDYFDYLKNGLGDAKWVRLQLKAIANEDDLYRKQGEALWPDRYDLTELNDIKKTLGPYEFSALYQANPVDDASREFKTEWFKTRTYEEVSRMTTRRFVTIDPNLKKSDQSDYCGVTRNYINSEGQWHLRSTRYRVNSKEVIDLIFLLHDEGFEKIGIEEGAFTYVVEPFLQEEMRKRGKFPNVVPLKHNQTMKETRIRGLIPWYAGHMIYHLEGDCNDLEEELLAFPKGTYDDCADATAYQVQLAEAPASARTQAMLQEQDSNRAAQIGQRLGL